MNNPEKNNILIIGGPNAGKTHYGGQLYGRLSNGDGKFKITTAPADLTIFQDVIDKLSEGKTGIHTEVSANRHLELKMEDNNQKEIIFSFPDYGGEQIKKIVKERKLNKTWKDYIDNSTAWILFIRLEEAKIIEDIVSRGLPDPAIIKKRMQEPPPVEFSTEAFYIELLQILLHFKGVSMFRKTNHPRLTIIISCWDLLDTSKFTTPAEQLAGRLPMLNNFISSTWADNSRIILGLSSTEKTLTETADVGYIENGPENFGYIVFPNGEKEKDLTLSISSFIGK